ncbi:MAG TPA: hypothetical protein EYN69_13765 [Flavobacteriales bacterium]|nr:hypothetical protein [Flavobacteriales bacterium]
MKKTIFYIAFFLFPLGLFAHGDLHERIQRITQQIEIESSNEALYGCRKLAPLYFERGLLYFFHEDYNLALLDYIKAEMHGYQNNELNYNYAEVYHKQSIYNEALVYVNKFLKQEPNSQKGYRLRSSIHKSLKRYPQAIADLKTIINGKEKPQTADYINLADNIMVLNPSSHNIALSYLLKGCERLGGSIILEIKALEINKAAGESAEAIKGYNNLLDKFNRKEVLLFEKAKYLFSLCEYEESFATLKISKELFGQLSKRQQNTKAMLVLKNNILSLEQQLKQLASLHNPISL